MVAAMQDPKEEKRILKLQTNKLHELTSRAAGIPIHQNTGRPRH
jgi:hypothetical protein